MSAHMHLGHVGSIVELCFRCNCNPSLYTSLGDPRLCCPMFRSMQVCSMHSKYSGLYSYICMLGYMRTIGP